MILYKEIHPALIVLAKRGKDEIRLKYANKHNTWLCFTAGAHIGYRYCICLICGETLYKIKNFEVSPYYKVKIHGIEHLKEHNLLPFI